MESGAANVEGLLSGERIGTEGFSANSTVALIVLLGKGNGGETYNPQKRSNLMYATVSYWTFAEQCSILGTTTADLNDATSLFSSSPPARAFSCPVTGKPTKDPPTSHQQDNTLDARSFLLIIVMPSQSDLPILSTSRFGYVIFPA